MAKLSRNDLKEVVKECLIEILAEGLVGDASPAGVNMLESKLNESAPKKRKAKKSARASRPALDNIAFSKVVEKSVGALTDDDIMASIFADTARTTLQEQIGAESKGGIIGQGDNATRTMDSLDPVEAFGDERSPDHWAQLAFANARPSKNNK